MVRFLLSMRSELHTLNILVSPTTPERIQAALPERRVKASKPSPTPEQASTRIYTFVQQRKRIKPTLQYTSHPSGPLNGHSEARGFNATRQRLGEAPPSTDTAAARATEPTRLNKQSEAQTRTRAALKMLNKKDCQRLTIPFFN